MGILRLAKPWPSRPDDLERALATAADSATPIDLSPGMNVSLIDWVKLIRKPGAVPHAYRSDWVGLPLPARRWIEDRGSFAGKHRLTEPNPRSAHHPYNCVNPREIVVVMSRKGPLVYSPATKAASNWYARHANEPVSDRERALAEAPGYVPCCCFETCPRNW